jgi:cytidylate kinase
MNHLLMVKQYLQDRTRFVGVQATGFPFITISRQAAAGGHLLAHVITTDMMKCGGELFKGWHVFDREICELVALDPSLSTSMEQLVSERYRSEFEEFMDGLFTGRSQQYMTLKKTFHIVRILAIIGKVIIVGRAGNCVTRSLGTGVHVRLVAPKATRIRWMMKKLRLDKKAAEKLMDKQDAEKRRMVRTFFDAEIDSPVCYDATFNTGTVHMHEVSQALIEIIKRRFNADGTRKAQA